MQVYRQEHTHKGTNVFVWVTVLRAYINWAEAKVILEEVTSAEAEKIPSPMGKPCGASS